MVGAMFCIPHHPKCFHGCAACDKGCIYHSRICKDARNDNTDIARIIKSGYDHQIQPEFWRWLTKNKGQDINQLVNAVVIDQQTQSYLLTRPDRIAGNIKGILSTSSVPQLSKKQPMG